jgi:hypothetical protein
MKYERKNNKLLPLHLFYLRLLKNFLYAMVIIIFSLGIGVGGYMTYEGLEFSDAVLNASMILSGMGPVNVLHSTAAKYFASFYALFSGITFLSTVGVLFAPILHRALHNFHLETD